MGARYGAFPKALAVASGVLCLFVAGVSLFSHPWGSVGSAVVALFWGLFLKLLVFGFEPEYFRVLQRPSGTRSCKESLGDIPEDEAPDVSGIVRAVTAPVSQEGSRILPQSYKTSGPTSRVIGNVHQERLSEEGPDQEDRIWADMARSL